MKKRVLVIDDEADIVNFLEHFLKRFNIPSITSTSGNDALSLYDKDTIGFVFLDVTLKDTSGLDVLKGLKEADPEVNVIMLTGRTEKTIQEKAKKLGIVDYITKPLDLRELKEKIQKYVLPSLT